MTDVAVTEPVVEPVVEPAQEPAASSPTEPTIADDPGESLPGAATWPEDWRTQFSGKDEDQKTLNRFKTPGGVWNAYNALRQKMSSGEFARTKPDTDDAEALKAWRTEIGVPETPEGYLESLPEGLEVPPEDQPFVDKYLERMHTEGASPKHVQDGLDWYYETQRQMADERATTDKAYHVESEEALRSEWGPEFLGNINNMKAMLGQYGAEELASEIMTARTDDGALLGDHPEFLRMLVNIASEINPNGIVTPSVGEDRMGNIDTRVKEIEAMMGDTKGRNDPNGYWNNQAMQEEYRKLLDLQDRYKGAA